VVSYEEKQEILKGKCYNWREVLSFGGVYCILCYTPDGWGITIEANPDEKLLNKAIDKMWSHYRMTQFVENAAITEYPEDTKMLGTHLRSFRWRAESVLRGE